VDADATEVLIITADVDVAAAETMDYSVAEAVVA
jgi:hypothetical protein